MTSKPHALFLRCIRPPRQRILMNYHHHGDGAVLPIITTASIGPAAAFFHGARRRLSTSSSNNSTGGANNSYNSNTKPSILHTPLPEQCDIVRGPSLLRTSASRPQPSLLFLPGLRSLPFWTQQQPKQEGSAQPPGCSATPPPTRTHRIAYNDPTVARVVSLLESNYQVIRNEYESVAHNLWSDYQADTEHHTLHQGQWDWHSYMSKGRLQSTFATHFVQSSQVLQELRDAHLLFEGVPFGYAFFSTLHAHSRIAPHHGPMNFRLRVHLPLVVPDVSNGNGRVGINVGGIEQSWIEGSAMVLDDSYVHHVWNDTSQARVILLVDIWHPDLSHQERREIVQLFQHAADQGWWSPPADT